MEVLRGLHSPPPCETVLEPLELEIPQDVAGPGDVRASGFPAVMWPHYAPA